MLPMLFSGAWPKRDHPKIGRSPQAKWKSADAQPARHDSGTLTLSNNAASISLTVTGRGLEGPDYGQNNLSAVRMARQNELDIGRQCRDYVRAMGEDDRNTPYLATACKSERHKRRTAVGIADSDDRKRSCPRSPVVPKQDAAFPQCPRRENTLAIVMISEDCENTDPSLQVAKGSKGMAYRRASR